MNKEDFKIKDLKERRKKIKKRGIRSLNYFWMGVLYGLLGEWLLAIISSIIIGLLIKFSNEYTGRYEKNAN